MLEVDHHLGAGRTVRTAEIDVQVSIARPQRAVHDDVVLTVDASAHRSQISAGRSARASSPAPNASTIGRRRGRRRFARPRVIGRASA